MVQMVVEANLTELSVVSITVANADKLILINDLALDGRFADVLQQAAIKDADAQSVLNALPVIHAIRVLVLADVARVNREFVV